MGRARLRRLAAEDLGGGASWLPVTILCLLLASRVSDVLRIGEPREVPVTVALFAVPVLYAVPRTRVLLSRRRWLVLGVQAVLTWVPFAVFGAHWQAGIDGLLAGLVLLVLPGRMSWLLAGGLLAADLGLRWAVTGLPLSPPTWFGVCWLVVTYVDDALLFFGPVRLQQVVGEMAEARGQAAAIAVSSERLAAIRTLQEAVGQRLAGIAARAAVARMALTSNAALAREQIAVTGVAARDAVARAREVMARQHAAPHQEPESGAPYAAAGGTAGAVIGTRLAWTVLIVVLSLFSAQIYADLIVLHPGALRATVVAANMLAIMGLQLRHSWAAQQGHRSRFWAVTLGVQAALVYVGFLPFARAYVGGLPEFLAGSVLLVVPGWWRWAGFAAVVASWPALYYAVPLPGVLPVSFVTALNLAANIAEVGLLTWGLARLAAVAAQLEALNAELAMAAVVRERLRIARDVHDLLGLGLSAIALKTDLVGQLIGRDDAGAAAEIGEMARICAASRADILLVTGNSHQLTLTGELDTARNVLASAGVEVSVDAATAPVPAAAEDVLVPVLREAVTNILRHSAAATCTIEAAAGDGTVRLRVSNDGIPARPPSGDSPGNGLANLTARLHAAGGRLASRQADGWFDLTAEIPLVSPAEVRD